ncbi:MAG: Acetylglutamate kinase [Microgenomates bacterium OLB23]|nr:MAG: Acetylglutamate kinase [Microgenomates bacterium OLB23]
MAKRLVCLKLGGSLITDKATPMEAKKEIIVTLAQQIAAALKQDPNLQLIIGNGAGSFGHYAVITHHMQNGLNEPQKNIGYAYVQKAVALLNRSIVDALLDAGVAAVSWQPSAAIVGNAGVIENFPTDVIETALSHNIVPVIYGDILLDTQHGSMIASTELLLGAVAQALIKKGHVLHKVIHNGATKGVLDAHRKVIPRITPHNFEEITQLIYATDGFDVTGGMLHKIKESLLLAHKGIPSLIINGVSEKDLLTRALLDEPVEGTEITA